MTQTSMVLPLCGLDTKFEVELSCINGTESFSKGLLLDIISATTAVLLVIIQSVIKCNLTGNHCMSSCVRTHTSSSLIVVFVHISGPLERRHW